MAVFEIPEVLDAGKYHAEVSYLGSEKYNAADGTADFTVAKKEITMNVTVDKDYRDITVNVNLSEKLDGNLTVLVNNTPYTLSYTNGTGSLILKNLIYGNYTISAVFTKDNYQTVNVSENVEINSIKTVLEAENVVMYYKDGTRFAVVMRDINGNPLANMDVIISINGRDYVKQSDENGTASLGLNLESKNYTVVTAFGGNSKYFGTRSNNTVSILSTLISKDIVKYYRNGTQFYATVLDFKGNPLANTTVMFNINGVFYNKTTDENGTTKLNIWLRPGKYIITIFNFGYW